MRKKNFIVENFHMAFRLGNEWRDTLLYGSIAGIVTYDFFANKQINKYLYDCIVLVPSVREDVRYYVWLYGKDLQVVGHELRPIDKKKLSHGVGAFKGALTLITAKYACDLMPVLATVPWKSAACAGFVIGMMCGGGPKEIVKSYAELMWDYPRKNNNGGPSQTRLLKDGLKSLFRDAADAFGRRGFKPIRATVQFRQALWLQHTIR